MKSYIDKITDLRIRADVDFEKRTFKEMNTNENCKVMEDTKEKKEDCN